MNLGLGNLRELKAHLLAPAEAATEDYDEKIAAIGRGVATSFEGHCNRLWGRVEVFEEVFPGGRNHLILSRYPIESVDLVELRTSVVEGWLEQLDAVKLTDDGAGIVNLNSYVGGVSSQIRVTYTGGYWFDESEDADEPDDQPAGSTLVPGDLKLAWLTQCARVWDLSDKLGIAVANDPDQVSKLAQISLVPEVRRVLDNYRRMAVT